MTPDQLGAGRPTADRPAGGRPHLLVVEARFYEEIADLLLEGARRALEQADATFDRGSTWIRDYWTMEVHRISR